MYFRCSSVGGHPGTGGLRCASAVRPVPLSAHLREWRNWQTRWLQVPVFERTWGFKSPLAHEKPLATQGISSRLGRDF